MDVQTSYVYFTNVKTNAAAAFGIGQWLRRHVYKNSDMEPCTSRLNKILHWTTIQGADMFGALKPGFWSLAAL